MGSHLFTGDTMFGLTGLVGLFSDSDRLTAVCALGSAIWIDAPSVE